MSKHSRKGPQRVHAKTSPKSAAGATEDVVSSKGLPQRIRLLVLFCVLFAVLASVWFTGVAVIGMQQLVRQHTARSRLDDAEYWLTWAERLAYRNAENALLAARIARYRGDAEELKSQLSEARVRGADLERVELERMLALAQVGALAEVETEIGNWLQRPDAELDEISNAYANGLAATGRFGEAYTVLTAWREDYPNDPRCNYRIGRLQEHQEKYDDAQESYRRAIGLDPKFYPARFSLGRAQLYQRKAEEALEQFLICFQMERPEAAMVEAAVALKALGRSDESRELLQQVLSRTRAEIDMGYRAVEEQPEGFRAAAEYGRLESDAGNFEQALPWLEAALQENPLDLTVRYSLGVTLRGLGRMADAQSEFERVQTARERMSPANSLNERIKRDPMDLEARYELGKLVMENESERIGLYWIRSIFSFDPAYSDAHQTLAEYYAKKAAKDPKFKILAAQHRAQIQRSTSQDNATDTSGSR